MGLLAGDLCLTYLPDSTGLTFRYCHSGISGLVYGWIYWQHALADLADHCWSANSEKRHGVNSWNQLMDAR
jgi:hypothetical protein